MPDKIIDVGGWGARRLRDMGDGTFAEITARVAREIADSTVAPLGAVGVYTGPWVDALRFARVSAAIRSDSATSQVIIDHAVDPSLSAIKSTSSAAGVAGSVEEPLVARYARLRITAGATPQTILNAQLILIS